MIFIDTDILSALAKVNSIDLLFLLFKTEVLYITSGVLHELERSGKLGRQYAFDVYNIIRSGSIEVVGLTAEQIDTSRSLPNTLGKGERESIAAAIHRGGIILSNESRVAYYCQQLDIITFRLPDVLRALWVEGIITKNAVQDIIEQLLYKDNMRFKETTLEAILKNECMDRV